MSEAWSDGLRESGFAHGGIARAMGWPSRVERMVEVEAALARALGTVGLLEASTVESIQRACSLDIIDLEELAARSASAATPVIPLIRALSQACDPDAAAHLHHGATSQDILDTAVVLQLRESLTLLEQELVVVGDRCGALADQHRHDLAAGRTLGQQASAVTLGLRAARWLGRFDRCLEQLRWVRERALTVQLGGAVGTLSVYGDQGPAVATALAADLGLAPAPMPWHAERERMVELGGMLMGVATAVGAVSTDLVNGARTEIGEIHFEADGGPTSSALPHKRNAVDAVAARAASQLATGELNGLFGLAAAHEDERAAGAWQAEWVALPSAFTRTAGALTRLRSALLALAFDADRARRNIDDHFGVIGTEPLATALAARAGRTTAQSLAARIAATAVADQRHLREVARTDPEVTALLTDAELDRALDLTAAISNVDGLIDTALAAHRSIVGA